MEANTVLNILSIEDSPQDFEIIHELLIDAGYNLKMDRVETEKDLVSLLAERKFDIILADFKLPGFDAFGALHLCNEICPDVPFICVSGSIGEETAVELLKSGAGDYILKDRLERLPFAVRRALDGAKEKEALRKTQESLRDREHSYRTLADSGQALIWTAGTDKLFNYFNRVWLDFTGRTLEQEMGNGWAEGVHPDDLQRCLDAYVGAFDRREKFSMEYRLRRHDGEYRWILDEGSPRYDSNGEFIGYIGHCLDITERKRAEKRERHLNSILRAIRNVNQLITKEKDRDQLIKGACENMVATRGFNCSWIVILDKSGRPVHLAESGLGKYRLPLKEIIDRAGLPQCAKMCLDRPGVTIIEDVFTECAGCPISSMYKGDSSFCVKLEKDGIIYGFLYASVPHDFATDLGEQSLFHEIGEDIAFALYNIELEEKRNNMETKLKDSEARYRALFEGAAEGILITETQTKKFIYANPAVCQMLGYTEDELRLLDNRNIHPDEVLERVATEFETAQQKGMPITQHEIPFLKKDGQIIWADVVTSPKLFIDERLCSATFFVDITEKKKAEDEKKKIEMQLMQSQKMEAIGRLSGGVAHDFNNMLTTIIGNSEIALMRVVKADHDEDLEELLEDIRLAGEKAATLTRQLLAFSRRQILQAEIFNLNEVVSEMDKMLRRLIGEDIELETRLSPDLGMVETDQGQVEQIIMNLAVNARDAMPEGGNLTIETESVELDEEYAASHFPVNSGHYEMISVSDTGIGISKEHQAQIFEPFFTTKPKGKGTGLGLSIVYGIVKQSNGYIWVYSEPGKGATFKIYLPSVEKTARCLEKPDKRPQKLFDGSETIMVVEDDAMIMKMVLKVLTSSGYTVLRAVNGNDALRVSDEHKGTIHLVLTDVIMPGMGGRELANRLVETRPDTKILYMSGYTDNAIVHHGVLDKGLFFIQKPFTSDNLKKKVREVLDNKVVKFAD